MSVVKKYVNNVRIANKIDTIGNWSTSELSLFNGEIAIVSCATDDIRLKIGDGNGTAVSELPYISYKPLEGHNYQLSNTCLSTYIHDIVKALGGKILSGDIEM